MEANTQYENVVYNSQDVLYISQEDFELLDRKARFLSLTG